MKFPIIQPHLLLGALCAAALVGGGCHTDNNRGAARIDDDQNARTGYAVRTQPNTYIPEGAMLDLAAVGSVSDPRVLAGRTVQCSAVPVHRVLDDQNILVDSGGGRAVCVHFQQAERGLHQGDLVSFTGTVKNMSDTARIVVGLSDKASSAVEDQPIFIDAQEVDRR